MEGRWMDARRMDGEEWMDGQTDGRTDRWMDTGSGGWEGGWMDAQRMDGGEGWEDRGQPLTPLLPQEAREASGSLRRELGDSESRRAALEQRLEQLSAEAGGCRRAQDEALREAARLRADIELLRRYPLPVRPSAELSVCPSVCPSVASVPAHPPPVCPHGVSVCPAASGAAWSRRWRRSRRGRGSCSAARPSCSAAAGGWRSSGTRPPVPPRLRASSWSTGGDPPRCRDPPPSVGAPTAPPPRVGAAKQRSCPCSAPLPKKGLLPPSKGAETPPPWGCRIVPHPLPWVLLPRG